MTPVSPQQPAEKLLSTPFVPAHVDIDPAFLTATPIWPEHATARILMAMNGMPPRSNLGPSLSFPPLVPVFCCGRQITRVPAGRALRSPAATWLSAATSPTHPG